MGHYSIDHAAIAALPGTPSIDGPIGRLAHEILAEAQVRAPVVTGTLVASGFVDGTKSEYTVGFTAPYAHYVEFGTGAHIERAHDGGALEFVVDGHLVITDEVHHPGTHPEPFLTPAAVRPRGRLR